MGMICEYPPLERDRETEEQRETEKGNKITNFLIAVEIVIINPLHKAQMLLIPPAAPPLIPNVGP